METLHEMYKTFEEARVVKAKAIVGDRKINPDPFIKFVIGRTFLCPHKLMDDLTKYWIEVIYTLDSEMGLTLPGNLDETPALFFDALSLVRSNRNKARQEDTEKKK